MKGYSFLEYRKLDAVKRRAYLEAVADTLGAQFRLKDAGTKSGRLPVFEQTSSAIEFRFIPGGAFAMGLSAEEEQVARTLADPPPLNINELRPVKNRSVASLLVSTRPVTVGIVKQVLGESSLSGYDRKNPQERFPAYLERQAALRLADSLHCRLPFEAEWEYVCRGGTKTAFIWGNTLLPASKLAAWLDLEKPDLWKANYFGLYALFSGDWCMDEYRESHADDAKALAGAYVIKGGGSVFWPWQDSGEWAWCMPANRMPSTGLIEGRCAFRLVREL